MPETVPPPRGSLDGPSLASYRDTGYLIVRSFLAPALMERLASEAAQLHRRIDLIRGNNLRCRWQINDLSGGAVFDAFDPVIDIAPTCREVSRNPDILALLESVYADTPVLFRDKLIFKKPGSHGYELHQDRLPGVPFPKTCVTVLIAIDRATRENGCIEVLAGHHDQGYFVADPEAEPRVPSSAADESRAVALELEPGDIALFSCFTPHRSSPNRSSALRRQLYLSYNAVSDGGDRRERTYRQYRQQLRKRFAETGKTEMFFR